MGDAETIVLRSPAELAEVRRRATERATQLLGVERSVDVGLVVSELSTNALTHGSGDEVEVRVGRDAQALLVAVRADADALPVVPKDPAPHHQPTGRGLRIVMELVDALDVTASGRQVEVLCRFDPARTA